MLITAFNDWIGAPNRSVTLVENIIRLLHNGSLLIDDIQDNSPVRRGKPAAHTIYGIPQVLNSGLFMFTQAVQEAKTLNNPESTDVLLENLQCLYLGQSWELYWKHNLSCPTESDYLNMVDNKTGGMFRMLVQLLIAEQSTVTSAVERERLTMANFDHLLLLLGRYYQIRDDYMNLKSTKYSEQKGFCEDLDEGKYSFPIVWLLERKPEYRGYINGVFRQLPVGMGQEPRLSRENKLDILAILEATGSLRATLDLLKELESALELEITRLEGILSKKNAMMRVIIAALSVNHV
ncbi:isoprenoid synthase domain-containing protein [Aspergillus tamarii]|uniref:Isoprenoid synthase domain-containing protein n=1 Tax=Aspergillus tamarii TaxID=41984 RepID=A0A5N6UJH0_ASPTM|nr:isoprenoid synthase domain-containing protein [Aspergillus tamarii]